MANTHRTNNILARSLRLKPIRFLASGGVLTVYAFALNWLLIEGLGFDEGWGFAWVLASQMVLGFLLNRYYIYDRGNASVTSTAAAYVASNLLLRAGSWAVFMLLVKIWEVHWFPSQILCTAIFVIIKYFLYQRIFERNVNPIV